MRSRFGLETSPQAGPEVCSFWQTGVWGEGVERGVDSAAEDLLCSGQEVMGEDRGQVQERLMWKCRWQRIKHQSKVCWVCNQGFRKVLLLCVEIWWKIDNARSSLGWFRVQTVSKRARGLLFVDFWQTLGLWPIGYSPVGQVNVQNSIWQIQMGEKIDVCSGLTKKNQSSSSFCRPKLVLNWGQISNTC